VIGLLRVPVPGLLLCAIAAGLVWFLPAAAPGAGNDRLRHAAAIVMLNGDVRRLGEVIRLYRDGWAPEIWLTQDPKSSSIDVPPPIRDPGTRANCETIAALGVPPGATRVLLASGTLTELRQIAAEVRRRGESAVTLVTSDYHARRVRVLWDAHIGRQPRAIVRAAPDSAAVSPLFAFKETLKLIVARLRLADLVSDAGPTWPDVPLVTSCGAALP
jgi:uncharacterized SAM-binding protein YcdF (DUF218 family)